MKKEYTPFGKYFSKLRKERKQSITDAAGLLGVSASYISSVEHGDREIPSDWRKKITEIYNLPDHEIARFNDSYFSTRSLKKISLTDVECCMTNMINNIAENDKQKEEMLEDLKRRLNEFRK